MGTTCLSYIATDDAWPLRQRPRARVVWATFLELEGTRVGEACTWLTPHVNVSVGCIESVNIVGSARRYRDPREVKRILCPFGYFEVDADESLTNSFVFIRQRVT